ncbi:hypothetical protein [Emticicia sp. 21SJ11W-3]|uniref:hypothetical protein n=1 Tax=Emticicia sp. 21SJ11W-3 TaxID=2916755 RepID=UPI00209E268F|nr:hypothetical protein [Emticicia sp. 21SJ11W-3]UTA69193.1 hypothetical protein MB380_05170 [Emticicia sp. 21SJ11W-3]
MRKLMFVAMLVAGAISANAQRGYDRPGRFDNGYDRIDSYQREARRQIAFGIEGGRITSNEAKRLLREAERIEMKENRFKRDGRLDGFERRELAQDLAMLNNWIAREKRDRDRITYDEYSRGYAGGRYHDRYGRY